ncbi:MAG: hypothetical protein ACWGO1_14070, partial [Anaerolineales bacterium]
MVAKIKYLSIFILAGLLAAAFTFPASSPARAMHDQDHAHMHVLIDIKPGSDPNAINLRSHGVIPVALFGSPELEVSMVDLASVRFGPMHTHDAGAPVANYA